MLKAEDKDATIEFLRSRIEKMKNMLDEIYGVGKYICYDLCYNPDVEDFDDSSWEESTYDVELHGVDEIVDLCDKTLAETTF